MNKKKKKDDDHRLASSQSDAVSLQKEQYGYLGDHSGGNIGGVVGGGVSFLSSLAARGLQATRKGWSLSVPPKKSPKK